VGGRESRCLPKGIQGQFPHGERRITAKKETSGREDTSASTSSPKRSGAEDAYLANIHKGGMDIARPSMNNARVNSFKCEFGVGEKLACGVTSAKQLVQHPGTSRHTDCMGDPRNALEVCRSSASSSKKTHAGEMLDWKGCLIQAPKAASRLGKIHETKGKEKFAPSVQPRGGNDARQGTQKLPCQTTTRQKKHSGDDGVRNSWGSPIEVYSRSP